MKWRAEEIGQAIGALIAGAGDGAGWTFVFAWSGSLVLAAFGEVNEQ